MTASSASSSRRPSALLRAGASLAALSWIAGVLALAPAYADTGGSQESVGVGITPATVFEDITARELEFDVIIFNNTDSAAPVEVEVLELGHGLDGTPVFGDPIEELRVVEGETSFTLAPEERRRLTFRAQFPDQPALHAAVVGSVEAEDAVDAIGVTTRFASLVLLRGPRPWDQELQVRDVGVESGVGGGPPRLYVDVANVGDTWVMASGTFTVTQNGQPVTYAIDGERVLPGYARRLRVAQDGESGQPFGSGEADVTVELDQEPSVTRVVDFGQPVEPGASDAIDGEAAEDRGATLNVREGAPAVLSTAAFILLLFTIALFVLLWYRRRDEEPEQNTTSSQS